MSLTIEPAKRHEQLLHWLQKLPTDLRLDLDTLTAASSDASFRRYFRIGLLPEHNCDVNTRIVMDAPPPMENCAPFIDVTQRLRAAGVTVPEILAADPQNGFMVLSDLGHQTYYDLIEQEPRDESQLQLLYRSALEMLVKLQSANNAGLPSFDEERLIEELQLFEQWFVKAHCKTELEPREQAGLTEVCRQLAQSMSLEPRVLVHRDFHSPNLMVCPAGSKLITPGVLDYQDAVSGALSYDIASLVFDARTTIAEAQQLDWAIRYWEMARAANLPVPLDFAEFHRHYEWSGLQRNLRILGVFARLNYRDHKSQYLAHIPRVLAYVRQVVARYQVFAPLHRLLDRLDGVSPEVKLTF
jgi:N-acetylmuramate 1-kinase